MSLLGMPEDPVAAIRNNKSDLSLEKGYYYYWLHYLFADILDSDPTFSSEWGDCLPLPATPAHALQELCFQQAEVSSSEIRTAADSAPVQKLNWRKNYPLEMLEAL